MNILLVLEPELDLTIETPLFWILKAVSEAIGQNRIQVPRLTYLCVLRLDFGTEGCEWVGTNNPNGLLIYCGPSIFQ